MVDGPVSRIEWVEDQLRQALLSGELQPGERLLTAQLSERFQVSPTPLREALHRFAGEGLVEFVPQRGARVTDLSPADAAELAYLRGLLEPECVGRAIDRGDDAWRASVEAASKGLLDAWRRPRHDPRNSEQLYRAFYAALTSPCDSKRLKRFATTVRDQDARYRIATIDGMDRDDLAKDHRRIVAGALRGDTAGAAEGIHGEIEHFTAAYEEQSQAPA